MDNLDANSRWNFDFITLVCLSTLIASVGLIQDSASVVIGAMLVAPLMTPLISMGLALVEGNADLIRVACKSTLFGFLAVFSIGYLMGVLLPEQMATSEMLSRGSPTVLDLVAAFVTGLAAAYALARLNVSSVLAGAGIAAALLPPIATSGIACAVGCYWVGAGAALLFLVNVLALILGAAVCLWAMGVRRSSHCQQSQPWARRAFTCLTIAALALALPLSYMLYLRLPTGRIPDELIEAMREYTARSAGACEIAVERTNRRVPMSLKIRLAASAPPAEALARGLARLASAHYQEDVSVRIETTLVHQAGSFDPSCESVAYDSRAEPADSILEPDSPPTGPLAEPLTGPLAGPLAGPLPGPPTQTSDSIAHQGAAAGSESPPCRASNRVDCNRYFRGRLGRIFSGESHHRQNSSSNDRVLASRRSPTSRKGLPVLPRSGSGSGLGLVVKPPLSYELAASSRTEARHLLLVTARGPPANGVARSLACLPRSIRWDRG